MKKPKFNRFAPEALLTTLIAGTFFVAATNAYSQSIWTGATDTFWNVADNWSPSGVPSSVAVTFDGTGSNLNTTLGQSFTVTSLNLTAAQTAAVTINALASQALTLTGTTPLSVPTGSGSHKFVGANATNGTTGMDLIFGASSNILSVGTGASFEIAGRIGASNTRSFNKQGSGTLILSANNGGGGSWVHSSFLISTGVLRFAANNAGGNSGNNYTVNTVLEIQGGVSQTFSTGSYTLNSGSSTGAIRSTSGNNSFNCSGTGGITLSASNSNIGVDADTLTIAAVIKGSLKNLTKVGAGTLTLSSANTYTGSTTVSAGIIRLNNANAIPGGIAATGGVSNLIFSGTSGVVGLTATSGDFLRTVGTGADQVTANPTATSGLGRSMGFAAYGGDRNVNLGATITLSSVSLAGANLFLGSADSDSKVTMVSDINLSNNSRNVTVANGSASVDAEISGVISTTNGSLIKSGAGTLSLTGANTYGGTTTVLAGTLAVDGDSIADSSTLVINGGKVDLTGAETVNKLYVGTTQLTAGTYSSDGAGGTITNANLTGSGTLIVASSGTPFTTWAETVNSLAGADALPGADPDNDGLQNTLEFVLGGNPKVSDNSTVRPVLTDGASAMTLTFIRSDESRSFQPVSVTVQVSADLGTWNPADDITIGATDGSGPNGTTYTVAETGSAADTVIVTIPKNSATKLFARIKAVIP